METEDNNIVKFLKEKDYKRVRNIGEGATGLTVLLHDETINEDFVCKKYIPLEDEQKQKYYQYFIDEIKLLYKSNHKNIVRVFNYYLYPAKITGYILMEYINGSNIRDYILNSPDSINDLFIQAIDGFKYLQENNILHRDIRESNILITNDGILKIIDFGFGRQVEVNDKFDNSLSLNRSSRVLPSEASEGKYDFKTEIYYLGSLFERIIKEQTLQSIFKYNSILTNMLQIEYEKRISSFDSIYRKVLDEHFSATIFTEEDKNTYNNFADCMIKILVRVDRNIFYINDLDIITKNLINLYNSSSLEYNIQDNKKLIRCFINGDFGYSKKTIFSIDILKKFIEFWNSLDENQKQMVINNLWNRFDNVDRYSKEDDLPF